MMAGVVVLLSLVSILCAAAAARGGVAESSGRDPFSRPAESELEARKVNPLERFALDELKLVATVVGVDPPRALVEDPSGLGFIVTPGTIVGAERGSVVAIKTGRVVVESVTSDAGAKRQIVIVAGGIAEPERP
jgi:Tfp pilus assembly protein PilP